MPRPTGRPKQDPATHKIDIRVGVDPDQLHLLKREAFNQRTSVSHLMRLAADFYLANLTTSESTPRNDAAAD